jgi:DNA-binding IscR family transcriptional regulator
MTGLAKAQVLLASRGLAGFRLARPARAISLLDVAEAVDGPLRGQAPRVASGQHARPQDVCDGVAGPVRRQLQRVSVADLAGEGA